ncbi:MAG: hypothetical protein EOO51_13445 [Flavobacterium sp.]|nr:MAG: hypothetical protein EOO51_13445 [Flavobacterium sp.]
MKATFAPIRALLLLLIFVSISPAYSQYERVDALVKTYPKRFSDPNALARRIATDFSKPEEKIRAIFTWLAINVNYDMNEYREGGSIAYSYRSPEDRIIKEKNFRSALVSRTLKTGKGVCEGYASVFKDVCERLGFEAAIIPGVARNDESQIGKSPGESDHAWNAVKVGAEWKLVDVTWAAGVVDGRKGFVRYFNDGYFFTSPERFFLNHFPEDPRWLLMKKTASEFANLPLYFPSFLENDYVFDRKGGVVKFTKNIPVVFKIGNLDPEDKVYYITSRDNVLQRVRLAADSSFQIYPSSKTNGFLTIFINEKPMVSYKISRE